VGVVVDAGEVSAEDEAAEEEAVIAEEGIGIVQVVET
jgi:hypothetical protein